MTAPRLTCRETPLEVRGRLRRLEAVHHRPDGHVVADRRLDLRLRQRAEATAELEPRRAGADEVDGRSHHVDGVVAAWSRSAPDLDVEPLEVVGRLLRLAALLMRDPDDALAELGLSYGDLDVLSTLLRESDRAGMHPSRLARSALITTGAMGSTGSTGSTVGR